MDCTAFCTILEAFDVGTARCVVMRWAYQLGTSHDHTPCRQKIPQRFRKMQYGPCCGHITFSLIYFQNLVPQPFETELNQKILLYCRSTVLDTFFFFCLFVVFCFFFATQAQKILLYYVHVLTSQLPMLTVYVMLGGRG